MKYGICKYCIIQVRDGFNERSELITQLLFGDVYEIIERSRDNKWFKIKISYDNYIGWIDAMLHFEISEAFYNEYHSTQHAICYDFINYLEIDNTKCPVLIGSSLPFLLPAGAAVLAGEQKPFYEIGTGRIDFMNFFFKGNTVNFIPPVTQKTQIGTNNDVISFLIKTAKLFLGVPYLWGGKTVFGTDCSGFVQQIFKICGYKLYRDAHQQANQGRLVSTYKDSKAGDLAFFEDNEGKISHLGIIIDDNHIIHASGQVKINNIDANGIFNDAAGTYTNNLKFIKRIVVE